MRKHPSKLIRFPPTDLPHYINYPGCYEYHLMKQIRALPKTYRSECLKFICESYEGRYIPKLMHLICNPQKQWLYETTPKYLKPGHDNQYTQRYKPYEHIEELIDDMELYADRGIMSVHEVKKTCARCVGNTRIYYWFDKMVTGEYTRLTRMNPTLVRKALPESFERVLGINWNESTFRWAVCLYPLKKGKNQKRKKAGSHYYFSDALEARKNLIANNKDWYYKGVKAKDKRRLGVCEQTQQTDSCVVPFAIR